MMARALGEEPASRLSILDAQRAVERAETDYGDAKLLQAALGERIGEARGDLELAQLHVSTAVQEVCQASDAVEQAVAAFRAAVTAFVKAEATMKWLHGKSLIPRSLQSAARFAVNDRDRVAPDAAWVSAIAALERDANTPLPR